MSYTTSRLASSNGKYAILLFFQGRLYTIPVLWPYLSSDPQMVIRDVVWPTMMWYNIKSMVVGESDCYWTYCKCRQLPHHSCRRKNIWTGSLCWPTVETWRVIKLTKLILIDQNIELFWKPASLCTNSEDASIVNNSWSKSKGTTQ